MPTPSKNILAYRYRLYPTKAQVSLLNETLSICRNVYNSLVHQRTVLYETTGKSPTRVEQTNALPVWKKDHHELTTVFSQVLQNVAKRVDLAFQAFFRRVREGEAPSRKASAPRKNGVGLIAGSNLGYPRLKGKGQYDSLTYPGSGFGFCQGKLRLSKIGDVAIHLHRDVEGTVKTCTVRRTPTGKWFACFSCEVQRVLPAQRGEVEPERLEPSAEEVGVDVGIKVFAALSNGEFIENPKFFRLDEPALAKAQRRFDRVKKPSGAAHQPDGNKHRTKARRKAKKVVARIHERIKNRRHDFVHQTARRLVNRFGVIAVEALQVDNMMRRPRPKPDPENEGRFLPNGASAKAGLNKSIADVSWSMFRSVLTMKAENAGRLVVAVNPAYTSQMCSGCSVRYGGTTSTGNIVKKTLDVRVHRCLICNLVMDRDTNAAVNIVALSNIKSAVGQYSMAAIAA